MPKGKGSAKLPKKDRAQRAIEKSFIKRGLSPKQADAAAWATVNKMGMLNNKNKKKSKGAKTSGKK